MDKNESTTDDGHVLFCQACNRRALAFLRAAYNVVQTARKNEVSRAPKSFETRSDRFSMGARFVLFATKELSFPTREFGHIAQETSHPTTFASRLLESTSN
jgi:hypothetical protein